jgi:hypothetical protein
MKRNETKPIWCAGESSMPKRSTYEERSLKRCDIRGKLSREDIRSSGSRDEYHEVIPP